MKASELTCTRPAPPVEVFVGVGVIVGVAVTVGVDVAFGVDVAVGVFVGVDAVADVGVGVGDPRRIAALACPNGLMPAAIRTPAITSGARRFTMLTLWIDFTVYA